ncbi:MAG: xylulokinase [Sphingomonadaceae bacterium]
MKRYLLGIDIGGTGAKAGVYTLDGELVGSGYGEYRMISTVPGQAEHDAEAWWRESVKAIRNAIQGVRPEEIVAVGVSCTNGMIAVDRQARPLLSAVMLWDQRCLPEVERAGRLLGPEEVFRVAGNPMAPGAYSLPTMLWLKHSRPEVFQAAHSLMVPGGYLVARLTGEFTIDHTRACTTLLFDIVEKRWHEPFLEKLGIPEEKLPRPLAPNEVAGGITPEVADLTGLKVGTPVLAGCMDSIAASLGSGVMEPGDCFVIMGTAVRVCSPLGEPRFDRRFMNCTHVLPNRWLAIGAMNGAGSSLRWVRDAFGQMERQVADLTGRNVYDLLTAEAASAPPGSKGLVFLPYVSGERTPIWNPYARGVFLGVTLGHNRHDFLRSVLEGAAFSIRHGVEILEASGVSIQEVRIGGAAATSEVWNQIIADVLGKPVVNLVGEHTEVLGAAMLAGVAVGAHPDYPTAIRRMVRTKERFEPDPRAHAAYDQLFPIYKELYPDVKPYMERLSHLDLPQVWVTKLR